MSSWNLENTGWRTQLPDNRNEAKETNNFWQIFSRRNLGNTSLHALGSEHATQVFPGSDNISSGFYLCGACWGATDCSWDKAMQQVHSATITRQVSLFILAIIYYRSIHSCVHITVLWRVEDTKHLSGHRACMRMGGRTMTTGRSKKDNSFHASLQQLKIFCLTKK